MPVYFIFSVMGWRLILKKMKVITDLNEIDRTTKEGRLLFAALAKITTESQTDKTPYEVLEQLEDLATKMDEQPPSWVGLRSIAHRNGYMLQM